MSVSYTHISNLIEEVDIPDNGIISKTLYQDEFSRAILFGFDAGQELSEHTASMPAILQILSGEATLTLGEKIFDAQQGTWAHMAPNLPHSVLARTPVVMLLTMLPSGKIRLPANE